MTAHYTDPRTGADVRIAIIDPAHCCDRLHTTPPPKDRMVWIVTEEGEVQWVGHYAEASMYERKDVWSRDDGEPGSWDANEIVGWSRDREDIEESAALFNQVTA